MVLTSDLAPGHTLVKLPSGVCSVRSLSYGETMHPAIGPVAEAEALYVGQLRLRERLRGNTAEFTIWDVGLGAAANAVTVLRLTCDVPARVRLVSFDDTVEPLRFALEHKAELGFYTGYENALAQLVSEARVAFRNSRQAVSWELHLADFPALVQDLRAHNLPKPDAILFDPYSPAKNPAMWKLDVFESLFRLLDPQRPCALATYSRSTMTRVALLLAGFFVGTGEASGPKEETTIAANSLDLIKRPLDRRWLERARRSDSAEPLREAVYRRAPLSEATWGTLNSHPQWRLAAPSGAGNEVQPQPR